jgi:hypothetical protein
MPLVLTANCAVSGQQSQKPGASTTSLKLVGIANPNPNAALFNSGTGTINIDILGLLPALQAAFQAGVLYQVTIAPIAAAPAASAPAAAAPASS